ncbi:MAG: betaine/proline/choline family ABC transporter ATP-binding protein [Pseudomonadota bacterium]
MTDNRTGSTGKPVKLSCRNVWKVYGDLPDRFSKGDGFKGDSDEGAADLRTKGCIPAAVDVSFDIHEGEIFVIMGLSGSGKSTMIRCLSRLVDPTHGEILLDGTDILAVSPSELVELRRHKMGMVFQDFGLLPHMSVLENVAFPLKVQGIGEDDRRRRAAEMIELVGLKGREDAYPRQLSGGQQQRVGIARSLAVEPELWFLDEPFSALDPLIRRQMQDEFLRLQKMLNKTIVFITHDFLEALKLADRIAIMKDGAVVQIAPPSEIVLNPATDYVAEFTKDAPVSRILRIEDVMEAPDGDLDRSHRTGPNETLEDVIARFAVSDSRPIAVVDDADNVVGMVTIDRISRGLSGDGAERPTAS